MHKRNTTEKLPRLLALLVWFKVVTRWYWQEAWLEGPSRKIQEEKGILLSERKIAEVAEMSR